MKKAGIIELIMAIIIATVPLLWIKDYYYYTSTWWTVVLAWHFGTAFGKWRGRNR